MSYLDMEPLAGSRLPVLLAADAIVNGGEIAVINASGYHESGSAATGLRAIGVWYVCEAAGQVSNDGGANGAKSAVVALSKHEHGICAFPLLNSATDPVTANDVGKSCFIEGPNTVAQTDDGGTLSRAGKVWGLTREGRVLVIFDMDFDQADIAALQSAVDAVESDVADLQTDVQAIQALPSTSAFGTATMVGGTIAVTGLTLGASDEIGYSRKTLGGTAGHVAISARTNGAGTGTFTLLSSSGTETSTFTYWIFTPGA